MILTQINLIEIRRAKSPDKVLTTELNTFNFPAFSLLLYVYTFYYILPYSSLGPSKPLTPPYLSPVIGFTVRFAVPTFDDRRCFWKRLVSVRGAIASCTRIMITRGRMYTEPGNVLGFVKTP